MRKQIFMACAGILLALTSVNAQRNMENLGRGVVAVRTGTTSAFISWRLLGLDPSGIGFNIYRSTAGATAVKLNSAVLTAGTNYTDASADLTKANAYYVKPVISGVEQAASSSFTLAANVLTEPCVVVPLRTPISGYYTRYVSVGDLDGDGVYDYVIDRIAPFDSTNNDKGLGNQKLEAYKSDGTFLWEVDLGSTSRNTYNITPGAATIDMGMWDGWTVYDIDSDGKAEVLLKTAGDVTFGDGTKLVDSNTSNQYVSVLNGLTGAERARIQFPTDYIARGQMGTQFAIAYLNGTTPSLVGFMKNRNADKSFNAMVCAWDFNGVSITQKWKWLRTVSADDGHTMRIADVDGDGKDEVCEIGFCLNGDGTLRYSLASQNVGHGDRFYVGKFDPTRAGLQGYGIQQLNPTGLLEYYYDANTGTLLWNNSVAPANTYDVGRGIVGDIDPRYAGTEVWSFQGIYNGPSHTQITTEPTRPYPCQTFWWNGDLLSDQLNATKFENWDYINSTVGRMLTAYNYERIVGDGTNPMFLGDIFGDWRTEVIYLNASYTNLVIFTTNIPTDSRIYTMAHNPQYRNQMTIKGYLESPIPDYFLGYNMATPATPNIRYVGSGTSTTGYEGESYTAQSGVVVASQYSGYSGTGYADYGGNATYIEWNNVWCQVAGTTTLAIKYSNGSTVNRQCDVTINGTSVGTITCAPTGGWGKWVTTNFTVNLKSWYNTVRITANTTNGGPNIDKMDVTSLKSASVTQNEPSDEIINPSVFDIFPNPVKDASLSFQFVLANRSEVNIDIKDITGKTVQKNKLGVFDRGKAEISINISSLTKGIYIVNLQTANGLYSRKLIKL